MALTDNLVAYYKLDESSGNAADATGNGYTLTNYNTVGYTSAKINNGADFGTTNTNKRLETSNTLGIDGGAITIAGWVKLNSEIGSGNWDLAFQGNGTSNVSYRMLYDYNGGTRRFRFGRQKLNIAFNEINKTVTLGTTNWHFVALTYDGTTARAYHNSGTEFGNIASSGSGGGTTSNGFTIAANPALTNFSSQIADEFGVWSRALTTDEITELYNSGAGLQYPFSTGNPGAFFQLFN